MVLKFSYIMAVVEQKMKSSSVANSDVATKQALRSCLVIPARQVHTPAQESELGAQL